MAANFYGELVVRFVGDTTSMDRALAKVNGEVAATTAKANRTWSQSAAKTGLAMQNVGRTFTQYYTLPVTAGLGYATYAAYNYQKAMIQVKELTGLTAAEAANFSDKIREASAEIGNTGGPQAAAEAYYFLASSGLSAQEAFDALTVAMKANVAGMGDIQVTADVISSAINVYRDSGLKAAEAMDILMRTIEVGKAEPAALSASLGRIMPIANQLGVSLDELGGNVAALTLGGLSSAEAVTSLRGSMVALVSPAKMSIEEMKRLGTSYKEITASIRDKGLLPTLKMLWELTDHNMLSMRKIIPNVRATAGVMSLLGDSYENNLDVIAKVGDHQGKLNQTYRDAAKTDVAAFNRALNQLKSTFIEVGAVVLPFVTKLIKWLGNLIAKFEELSPATQKWAVGFMAATAVLFPLMSVIGSLVRGVSMLAMAFQGFSFFTGAAAAATTTSAAMTTLATTTSTAGVAMTEAATAQAAWAALATPTVGGIAAMTAGVVALGIALYALGRYMDSRKEAEMRAYLQPKILTDTFTEDFTKEMKKSGFDKVVVDGIVYYNYTVEPQPEGGPEQPGKTIREQWDRYSKIGSERIEWLEEKATKLAERIRAAAIKVGGPTSLAALLGQDIETNLYRGLALRPKIQQLTDDIAAMIVERDRLLRGTNRAAASPSAKAQAAELDEQIKYQEMRLANFKKMWDAATEKMSVIREMEPQWDYSKGLKGLRAQMRQYSFDIREFLGKPMKMPKIDFDMKPNRLKGQLEKIRQYISNVVGSQEITVNVKRNRVRKAVREIETELAQVNARIKRTGITPELKAKKEKLEDALRAANRKLDNIGKRTAAPTLKIAGRDQAIADVRAVKDELDTLTDKNVTITVTSYKRERAWGGIVKKPELSLVGEAGPEVIIPLTKPARAAQLLKESGLANYTDAKTRPTPMIYREQKQAPEAPPTTEIHYHNHMALPQGIVVSDVERFSRTVQPYVERGTLLAQRRRQRGRPGL